MWSRQARGSRYYSWPRKQPKGRDGDASPEGDIAEAMRRHREGESGDPVFERLLGVEMKREQYAQGRAFCDTVVELTDEVTLARMWDSADAMPSLPEVVEPRLWLARTV